jgi:hypothetical protein
VSAPSSRRCEAALQGAVGPFAAAAGLRGIAEDVLDAEPGEGAADLGRMPAIHRAARDRRIRGPVRAIGVERHGQAVALEHGVQRRHDRGHALAALVELGVEDALGGVVDDHDHGEPLLGEQGEPVMATAVEVQQLAEARPRLAAATMATPGLLFRNEARGLQGLLDEGIAEAHAVVTARELMEVADIEALVAIAIEGEQPLDVGHGRPLGRGRLAAPIEQPVIAVVLELPAQAADTAGSAAEDVGGLQPGEFAGQGADNDLLHLHGTLHSAGRIGHRHLLGAHSFHATRQERSFHVSPSGGHFTYPQHTVPMRLTVSPARTIVSSMKTVRAERYRLAVVRRHTHDT